LQGASTSAAQKSSGGLSVRSGKTDVVSLQGQKSSKAAYIAASREVYSISVIWFDTDVKFAWWQKPVWNTLTSSDDETPLVKVVAANRQATQASTTTRSVDKSDADTVIGTDEEHSNPRVEETRNFGHPVETHLVYPASSGKISLTAQSVVIQSIGRGAIQEIIKAVCFKNAFPVGDERTIMSRDALYRTARDRNHMSIAQRIRRDSDYAEALSGLVSTIVNIATRSVDGQVIFSRLILVLPLLGCHSSNQQQPMSPATTI
jgi:hypothetical protein